MSKFQEYCEIFKRSSKLHERIEALEKKTCQAECKHANRDIEFRYLRRTGFFKLVDGHELPCYSYAKVCRACEKILEVVYSHGDYLKMLQRYIDENTLTIKKQGVAKKDSH